MTTAGDIDFAARLDALGEPLHGFAPELVADAVRHYVDGASAQSAARLTGISEHRIRNWIRALGLGRTQDQSDELRRAGLAAGRAIQLDRAHVAGRAGRSAT